MNKKYLAFFFTAIVLLNQDLFAASHKAVDCQSILPENPIENQQCPEAYNRSASILVSDRHSWLNHLFIDLSYTYWYAGEDGLSFGRNGYFVTGDDPFFTSKTTLLSQPFQWQSGFKIGAGWRKNDWVLAGEYTWVRNSTSQNSPAPSVDSDIGSGVWLIAPWFLQLADDGGGLSGIQVASKWHLAMDIADLMLSRPYYQGRHLTIIPAGGLRAAWIRQKMNVTLIETPGSVTPYPAQPIHSSSGSHSWAIGPKLGTKAHVLLGLGFRFEGDIAASLLFTEYTKIFHKEEGAAVDAFPSSIYALEKNRTALRPVFECGLGVGWGSYLYSNKYYIDFSADYDFMYWWNQNMMREFLNNLWREIPANGDLYLHGLTLSGRFDF